jgi:16S rRNA (guanine1207-N2)-methyltransferase
VADAATLHGVYGMPPADLIAGAADAVQFSPLIPGAASLEEAGAGTLAQMSMLAPPGTVERRYAMASSLRALASGARFTVLAPKDKGGSRIRKELEAFNCAVTETAKRHFRICAALRPAKLKGVDDALAAGAPQVVADLNLWSQPGVFSWNRIDPGSALLAEHLPPLTGNGADFGCGNGSLARVVLASPQIEKLTLIDIDRRAIDAARRNVDDPRVSFDWKDLRVGASPNELDFVVMNPPFHDGGAEDQSLGRSFIERASQALRTGGVCWLVANRHLPYEAVLAPLFSTVSLKIQGHGYKIYEARK